MKITVKSMRSIVLYMHGLRRLIAVLAVTAFIPLFMIECDNDTTSTGANLDLAGSITITPSTAVIGTELTATYTGNEAVNYKWEKDGATNVGTNSNKYTPTQAGTYTVTVSATGYNSKTSAVVDVSDPSLSNLSGTITITPSTGVTTGTELTATYTGNETVSYRWEKDGGTVGTNNSKYTPTVAGSYTVTVSANGYNSKTSAAVTVTVTVTVKTYNVSFVTNGGTPVTARDIAEGGKIGTVSTTKTGYTLEGWYTDSGFTTQWNLETDIVDREGIVLYAKWAINANTLIMEFAGLIDEKIDLTLNGNVNTISISGNDHLVITVQGDWDYYYWYIDGKINIGATAKTFEMNGNGFEKPGIHTITAIVGNGYPYKNYSKELTIKVVR
ncbi:InlB B-repeat-containing protein [Treponema sp. R80B11-R83G3]